jgi:hypothetical protein
MTLLPHEQVVAILESLESHPVVALTEAVFGAAGAGGGGPHISYPFPLRLVFSRHVWILQRNGG